MAEVKLHQLNLSVDDINARLAKVIENAEAIVANSQADELFRNEIQQQQSSIQQSIQSTNDSIDSLNESLGDYVTQDDLTNYVTKNELNDYVKTEDLPLQYDDTAIVNRITALENRKDNDTVYNDEEVRGLITALTSRVADVEAREDSDTVYDDDEVRGLIAALTERVAAVEGRTDNDTVYNDEEVRGLISALTNRVSDIENASDGEVYDDTEVRDLITALTNRVATVEGRTDSDTVYDDTEVRGLITALNDRLTNVENDDTPYNDEEVRGLIDDLTARVAEVEAREDHDTLYDDTEVRDLITALTERVNALPTEDTNTVYDDEEVRGLIAALSERMTTEENKVDQDTVYDDEEVRGLIASLAERLTAEENKVDNDTVYNDEEVRGLIDALTTRMTTEENKVDKDTIYNDSELRDLITALTARVAEVEAREDSDTVYDDAEVRSLIASLTERLTAEENKVDKDTVYDDTDLQTKYNSLNTKYNELFDFVYASATPEQATMMNASVVNNAFENGETSVEITNGELGDVTIPETTKGLTINAPMQDGATVTLSSPKYVYLNNTSENPVSVTIDSPEPTGTSANTTIYAGGEYDTITLNNASLNVNSKLNELQVENVVVENTAEEPKSNSVTAVFVGENPSVSSETATTLTINNKNAASSDENVNDTPNMTINAPNATVTLNNSWDNVASTVGDNTLIIGTNARINKLTVLKGNVIVKDTVTTRCINEVVNETENYTVDVYRKTVMDGSELSSSLISNCGYTILGDDITRSRLTWGILGAGNYVLDLNGHTLTISDTMLGLMTRNTVNLTIIDSVGTGKFISEKSYGLWAGNNSTITINVPETTEIIGVTHTLYCEGSGKPHINVIGGTYKMIVGEDETDVYDVNGNYKFMFNHLDSTYTREGNCFTITGGRFVGFDPSHANGEPGGEYSMVDLNEYEVLTENTQIDGMNVYKVVKKSNS